MLYGRRSDSRAIQDNTVVWLRELLAAGDYERLSKRAITMINHNESARFLNALSSIDVPTKRHGENHEFDRMLTAITAATILTAFLESAHDQTAAFVAYMWDVTGLTLEDPIVNQEFRSKILKAHPTSVLISHVNSYRYFADYEKFGWNVNALLQTLFSELAARPLTSGLTLHTALDVLEVHQTKTIPYSVGEEMGRNLSSCFRRNKTVDEARTNLRRLLMNSGTVSDRREPSAGS
jgi:hypothetical protein